MKISTPFKRLLVLFAIITLPLVSNAQEAYGDNYDYEQEYGGNDTDMSFPDDPPPGEGIPIDGGISFLAASGLAYGIAKVYRNKKKR